MKKRIAAVLIVLLAAACLCAGASANSWGLTGRLYRTVEQAGTWDNYTVLGNQAEEFAVMQSRYHNALFYVDDEDELHVWTTAVYQPDDNRKDVKLAFEDGELTIRYGEDESYTFSDTGGGFELTEAEVGSFRMETVPADEGVFDWRYSAEDGEGTAVFPYMITLDTFNIRLFPRSAAQARSINLMHALLEDHRNCLDPGDAVDSPDSRGLLMQPNKSGTVPVYSAPSVKAWRAGKGKAAVGMNGSLWLLKQMTGTDGNQYACIRYDVSERTQRIGWALCIELAVSQIPEGQENVPFVQSSVKTAADTFLTDDPDVSQYAQFSVPKGTALTCLGLYNDYYAYVAATEKNGKITGKGTAVWGFVPLRDLQPVSRKAQGNVMKKITGDWYAESGGTMAGDLLTLNADGTFASGIAGSPDEEAETLEGTWYVTKYDTAEGLYWDEPEWQITLLYGNGSAYVYGMSYTDTHLNLTNAEGGGSYAREYEADGYPDEE